MENVTMLDMSDAMMIIPWGMLLNQFNTKAGLIGLAVQLIGIGIFLGE
jgi:hypothetical protein